MKWFAVMTKARKEQLAFLNLKRQGYVVFYPHYLEWTKPKKVKPRLLKKPYMPRYLFAAMTGGPRQSFYSINNTIGVSTVVYCGYNAFEIPVKIIGELQERADESGEIDMGKKKIPDFPGKPGDKIRFSDKSPFFGLLAELKRVDINGRIVVELEQIFGASREISIKRTDVGGIIPRESPDQRPVEPTTQEDVLPANGGSPS